MALIRPATISDLNAVIDLGVEAMTVDPLPNMVVDRDKIRVMAVECISGPSNFCWVCEDDDGQVVGAVSAIVQDCLFYQRRQATVLQFYCKKPGQGIKLLREFLRWARGRPIIKMIVFALESGADPRIGKLLERLGLGRALPIYMETR